MLECADDFSFRSSNEIIVLGGALDQPIHCSWLNELMESNLMSCQLNNLEKGFTTSLPEIGRGCDQKVNKERQKLQNYEKLH